MTSPGRAYDKVNHANLANQAPAAGTIQIHFYTETACHWLPGLPGET